VAIVGEFDSDEIIDLAQRYIGTLPAGAADSWEDHAPDPPEGVVTRSVGAGTSDSGAGVTMLFSLATEVDDRTAAAVLVLQTAINSRLFESVREELGASYNGGRVFINDTDTPDAYLEALVTIDGDPDRVDEIHQRVLDELADLARNGLDQDEFERATSVVLGDLEFINNGELINQLLSHVLAAPSDRRTLIGRYQAATGLTRREVADLARQLFDIDQRIEVFRTPS
jgi:zinc protease